MFGHTNLIYIHHYLNSNINALKTIRVSSIATLLAKIDNMGANTPITTDIETDIQYAYEIFS